VTVKGSPEGEAERPNPHDLLYSSDSEDEGVRQIRVADEGSRPQLAHVIVHGVPADGVIDTGADITIMGQELFARVAAAAKLRKKNFRKADKVPRTYDRKTFHLDGCMDMDLSFAEKTMRTTVYIKIDAHDQLLLSEGICRQLGIVSYHPSVSSGKIAKKTTAMVPTISCSHSGCRLTRVPWSLWSWRETLTILNIHCLCRTRRVLKGRLG